MGGRTRPVRSDNFPDPCKYDPLAALKRITTKVPSYSMGAKFRSIERDPYFVATDKVDGKAVVPPQVKNLVGTGGPKYSFGGKNRVPRDEITPSPDKYANQTSSIGGPRFSMSARVRKGINYGYWGDESRLKETQTARTLPQLQVIESR